jgi:hypothetical protein
MNMHQPLRLLALAAVAGALSTAVVAAPKAGDTVYSLHAGTPLYPEAKKSDAVAGTVGFAEALKIQSVTPSGMWLNVSAGGKTGWVFKAMIAEKQPEPEKTTGVASVDASSTTTAAAARPLSPEAEQYAQRHNQVSAGKDVDWVEAEAHKVTKPIVDSYMKENKKGEFQE